MEYFWISACMYSHLKTLGNYHKLCQCLGKTQSLLDIKVETDCEMHTFQQVLGTS